MAPLTMRAAALLGALAYADEAIVVDVADRSANSPLLKGYHFSPLNHQIYGVYSQMVYDESFEQSLSDLGGARSLGWSGDAAWVNDSAAFNGNVSVRLEPGARLSNRGLYQERAGRAEFRRAGRRRGGMRGRRRRLRAARALRHAPAVAGGV